MYLSDGVRKNLRTLAGVLYSRRLDAAALNTASPEICAAMGSHYFALMRFSGRSRDRAILFSNNPPEFLETYSAIHEKDFILKRIIETQNTVSLREIPGWDSREKFDFTEPIQKIRPISDVIYVPARIGNNLAGYWAIGRAGLNSPIYDDNDFKIFEFISSFLTDAVRRSYSSIPEIDDVAHLDGCGRVLYTGSRIGSSFIEIFGSAARDFPCGSETPAGRAFRERFLGFLYGGAGPCSSRFLWKGPNGKLYDFSFQLWSQGKEMDPRTRENISIMVIQAPEDYDKNAAVLPLSGLRDRFNMTDREIEVVRGLYQGKTNKDIGIDLNVSEPTAKRILGGIYEKTGATSRTRLLLKLSL
jgi:DNA-binding CsgD family transcriptional regulator